MMVGPANALSGLMCEYGESDEDSDAENDKHTHNDGHTAKEERTSCILLVLLLIYFISITLSLTENML